MIYLNLIFNLALLVALSIISGFIEKRKPLHSRCAALLQGLLFGGAAIVGMLRPLDLGSGLIFDGRSVVLSLCALFFGPWAGSIAAVMAIACRLWIGGIGAMMGILVILSSMSIGLWAHFRVKPEPGLISMRTLYLLGLAVHVAMVGLMFALPAAVALTTIQKIGLPVLLLYPLATVLGGKVLVDQTFAARFVDVLQKTKQNLEVTLQSIGEAVIATDVEGRIVRMNPEAERLTGWTFAEAGGKYLSEVFHVLNAETRERILNPAAEVLRSGAAAGLANHSMLVGRDGAERHITDNASPIRHENGEIIGVVLVFRDVTESYRTQSALRESEESYRRLFHDHATVKMIIDPGTGSILDVNEAAVSFYGWPREQLVRMNVQEINTLPPAAIFQEMEKARNLKRVHFEFRHRLADGSVREVEVFTSRILVAGKEVLHSIVHDVTEHKLLEEKLKQTDSLLANIAERVPGVVYQYRLYPDGSSCFPYASPGIQQIYEVTPESVREDATPVFGRLHPDDHALIIEDIMASARTLEHFHCEFRVILPQQGLRWRLCDARPQRTEDGGTLWYGIISDITERKLAEAERERLLEAIEQAGEVVCITDAKGTIQYVNPAFEAVTGYARAEAIGRNPRILKGGTKDEAFYRNLWEIITSGKTWKGELINRRKTGEIYTEEATISPVCDPSGRISNFVAVKRDITENRQLAAQLLQAQRMESVGRLAGGVAHDFNNMLTVILGHAEMLLSQSDPALPIHADLSAIQNAAERSARITRQLLAFARKQTIAPKVLDLNDTVEGMLKMLRRLIGEDIDLAWHPGRDLWPVRMDPSQIDQMLANLCVNARDAIDGIGRITIETANVTIHKAFDDSRADFIAGEFTMLAVSDNGCGMDRDTLAKIFDPFFTTKELGQGTGLGLSTVYGIVKQNRGFVNVYSEPGKGTTFRIYLPRERQQVVEAQKIGSGEAVPHGNETLLLVEDEKAILNLGKIVLEKLGYRILVADTPEIAIQLAKSHAGAIQLLITDVIMPGMNGRELAAHLKSLHPDIKCLYMSGYTANVIAHHGVLDSGVHFLAKPFNVQDLATKVRDAIECR